MLLASAGLAVAVVVLAPAGAFTWAAAALAALVLLGQGLLAHSIVRQAWHSEEDRMALEMSHQCLQEAIDALPVGIAIYDQHDRLLLFNPRPPSRRLTATAANSSARPSRP